MKEDILEKMKYKLWYDKGYDYKFLNRISKPELKGVYNNEF